MDLWQFDERNARAARSMAAELFRLVQLLDRHDIRSVPYKGPILAHALHGDVTRRAFSDLDVLIEPQHLRRARTLLESDGYLPEPPLSDTTETALLNTRANYHRVLAHPETGVTVELHWKTDPDYVVEGGDDAWWGSLATTTIEGHEVRRFSDEELVLILCLHGTRHHGHRLGWLAEIAELGRQRPQLAWTWITGRAAALGCSRRLNVALVLAHEQLGMALPPGVVHAAGRDPAVRQLADRIMARMFRPGVADLTSAERLGMSLKFYERAGDRIGHLFEVALAPSLHEWSRWPLPRPLFVLYLPLRLARLARKYAAHFAGRG
jgi:hypothetical protein